MVDRTFKQVKMFTEIAVERIRCQSRTGNCENPDLLKLFFDDSVGRQGRAQIDLADGPVGS